MEHLQQDTRPVTMGEWLVTFIVTAIPLVGIIMLFVWAFGSGTNVNKANWAKAALIMAAIVTFIYILIFIVFGAALLAGLGAGDSFEYYE